MNEWLMVGPQLKLVPLELEAKMLDGAEGGQELTVEGTVGYLCPV